MCACPTPFNGVTKAAMVKIGTKMVQFGRRLVLAGLLPCLLLAQPLRVQDARAQDTGLPAVLSTADAERYGRIFELQAAGDMDTAAREIKRIKDPILMGHVLQQRYLHPSAYVSSFAELSAWMKNYRDHPGAEEVYQLALRKKGRKEKAPSAPVGVDLGEFEGDPGSVATARARPQPKERDPASARMIAAAASEFSALLRRDKLAQAEALLNKTEIRQRLSASEYDDWRRRLAWMRFLDGEDERALDLAAASARRSRGRVPEADWVAGLAAWRLGRYDNAAHHFEHLAFSDTASNWDKAAAGWWGARVMLRLRQPGEALRLLQEAASQERTFYGLLALGQLGQEPQLSWAPPPLSAEDTDKLLKMPAVRRAIALSETGEAVRADREIVRLFSQSSDQFAAALLGLAGRLQAPASAMRIGLAWRSVKGEAFDTAMYPMPPWEPEGGFVLDRALIFAFMRQESAFNPRAQSTAGAAGLMQLMPRTAGSMAGDSSLRSKNGRHKLFAPEYNIELGQRYLQHLLEMPMIRGNLFHLAAAYNGGPGNLQRWLRENKADDPLLFIETIPLPETRTFVQRVLTNHWIYRDRIGQPRDSLLATVGGSWPVYRAHDSMRADDNQTADRQTAEKKP